MVSEAVHSAVDTLNQGLLAVGLERSKKRATLEHPYGHGHEMYVFALLAGVGAFCLGSGVAVYHGIHSLLHPEPIESVGVGLAVLLFAGCAEGYTLSVGMCAHLIHIHTHHAQSLHVSLMSSMTPP
jgi:divalent metal cation (Fe/Co/Zn/Cd) transporter